MRIVVIDDSPYLDEWEEPECHFGRCEDEEGQVVRVVVSESGIVPWTDTWTLRYCLSCHKRWWEKERKSWRRLAS